MKKNKQDEIEVTRPVLGGEAKKFTDFFMDFPLMCPGCKREYKIRRFYAYEHDGGLKGTGANFWIYSKCPYCDYEASHRNIERQYNMFIERYLQKGNQLWDTKELPKPEVPIGEQGACAFCRSREGLRIVKYGDGTTGHATDTVVCKTCHEEVPKPAGFQL